MLVGVIATTISTARLMLEPLRADHAAEMFAILDDPTLHEFIGGSPKTLAELEDDYAWLADYVHHPEGEAWLNWIIRLATGDGVGTVQATVVPDESHASIAWVVAQAWQRQGYASEAATALVDWLADANVCRIDACVVVGHVASERVAAAAGMRLTRELVDGERVWRCER